MMVYGDWLELASHLHMPLRECLRKHTHRELQVWRMYLEEQWNKPSRVDNYLMQIAGEIRRVYYLLQVFGSKKKPYPVELKDFYLEFEKPKPTKEKAEKASKRGWFSVLGVKHGD